MATWLPHQLGRSRAAAPPSAQAGKRLGAEELERLWADLAARDSARAYRAVAALEAAPEQAVALLRRRLGPVSPRHLRRLLDRLNSDRFFTTDYRPEVYTPAGMEWINNNGFASVLLRHYPNLRRALQGVKNPFAPWSMVSGAVETKQARPEFVAVAERPEPAFTKSKRNTGG